MSNNNLKEINVDDRWHMVSSNDEEKALSINNTQSRLSELYKLNMNHDEDYSYITELVKEEHLKNNKYNYVIQSGGMTTYYK